MHADTLDKATSLLQHFEGFISTPKWDVNALRVGYGSDTITKADGSVHKVVKGMTVSKEDALRDLRRRIPQFEAGIVKTIGQAQWDKLPSNAQAALLSVAYNYGSIGRQTKVVAAAKSGNLNELANAVRELQVHNGGINKRRRNAEADYITSGTLPSGAKPYEGGMNAGEATTQNTNSDTQWQGVPYALPEQPQFQVQPLQQIPQTPDIFGMASNGNLMGLNFDLLTALNGMGQQNATPMLPTPFF